MKKIFASVFAIALVFGSASAAFAQSTYTASYNLGRDLAVVHGRDLTIGNQGLDVVELQAFLGELGYLDVPASISYGYFGSMTKTALMRYQASRSIISTGYFGPLSKQGFVASLRSYGWNI